MPAINQRRFIFTLEFHDLEPSFWGPGKRFKTTRVQDNKVGVEFPSFLICSKIYIMSA